MAKKMSLSRERATPNAQVPSISREEPESEVASSSGNNPMSGIREQLPFMILDETSKPFPEFNATGRSLMIKFRPPRDGQEQTTYFNECVTALTNYLVDDMRDRDLVGLKIQNTENVQDKVVGISFRLRGKLKPDVVWGVVRKVVQSNARFGLTDRLEVHLHHVRMPAVNSRMAEKMKGRYVDVMSTIKNSIVVVKAAFFYLANALLIAMARLNGDPKYKSYRNCRGMKLPVEDLLNASGVKL